jgi:hypothetical protein
MITIKHPPNLSSVPVPTSTRNAKSNRWIPQDQEAKMATKSLTVATLPRISAADLSQLILSSRSSNLDAPPIDTGLAVVDVRDDGTISPPSALPSSPPPLCLSLSLLADLSLSSASPSSSLLKTNHLQKG